MDLLRVDGDKALTLPQLLAGSPLNPKLMTTDLGRTLGLGGAHFPNVCFSPVCIFVTIFFTVPIFSQYWPAYFTNLCGLPQYFPDVFPIVYQYFPDMSSWCNLLPKRLGKCAAPNIAKILAKYAETPVFFAYFAKRFISAGLHIFPIFLGSVPACLHIFCIFSQSLGRRIGNCFPILACMFYPSLWAAPIFSRCFPNSLPIFS